MFPLSFDMGEVGIFGVTFIAVGRSPKRWEALWSLPASVQAQVIVKGMRKNETATVDIDVTEEILWNQASWSRMFCNDALVNLWMNLPTADKIKQTGATCLEKTSAMKL